MLLPMFMTCDTLDFSHSIGSVNSPWNAIFIYERYPHGLGFTEKAYEMLHQAMPAVLDNIRNCPCEEGCPCCVGKPLRQYATWNVERGEASIPSKAAARMILELLLGDATSLDGPDAVSVTESRAEDRLRLERALRRRLERMREPEVFHPIEPQIETGYPAPEKDDALPGADVARRAERRRSFRKELRKRIAKRMPEKALDPLAGPKGTPPGMKQRRPNLPPTSFPGKPAEAPPGEDEGRPAERVIRQGDSLAARARRRARERKRTQ
jgi:hypothetical protein